MYNFKFYNYYNIKFRDLFIIFSENIIRKTFMKILNKKKLNIEKIKILKFQKQKNIIF